MYASYHTAADDPVIRSFGPGPDDQPIYRVGPGCNGMEENVDECGGKGNLLARCDHDDDVGIIIMTTTW